MRFLRLLKTGSEKLLYTFNYNCKSVDFFKRNCLIIIIVLISLVVRLVYLSHTPYYVRTYDVVNLKVGGGHLDYVKFVAKNNKLPPFNDGWEYHQEPIYYIISAVIYNVSNSFYINPIITLQLFALTYSYIFLYFSYKIVLTLTKNKNLIFYLSVILLFFWPSGIIGSIRIGNDSLLYAFYAGSLFFIQNYYFKNRPKDLVLAFLFSALSLLTKINAIPLFLILLIVFIIKLVGKKINIKVFTASIFIIILIIFLALGPRMNLYLKGQTNDWLLANQDEGGSLLLNNRLENYINFDIYTFLTKPLNTRDDSSGRQYFFNFLLKSSLFGEFSFPLLYQYLSIIMFIISFLSLFIFLFFLVSIFNLTKNKIDHYLILIFNLIFNCLMLLGYRITRPYSANMDFRLIYPVIISLIFFSCTFIEDDSQKNKFRYYVLHIVLLFSILCGIFFILPM